MKIKLAILDSDLRYLNRIANVFTTKYADKFEVYSFTDGAAALSALEKSRIDVFLASSDAIDVDTVKLPRRCAFAYFVDSAGIDTVHNQRAVCKFQKAELIYKQILNIYSENAGNVSGLKLGGGDTKLLTFSSVSGGTGTSTMAAACAMHYAQLGSKTLYLNLEKFGSADVFFSAEGQFDFSEIIYAIRRGKKTNLAMKLESCVKRDASGVFFYSKPKVALDMLALQTENILQLISELEVTGEYDYIILDMEFGLEEDTLQILRQSHAIIWVGDGSEISNAKLVRAYEALSVREQNEDVPLFNRLNLIYNKFSNKTGKTVGSISIKNVGGAPRFEHASTEQVLEQLKNMEMFERII